jgi:hypothetical protein
MRRVPYASCYVGYYLRAKSDLVSAAGYSSAIVLPTTTQLIEDAGLLRLQLMGGAAGLERDSDILIGQLIAVSNDSSKRRLGVLGADLVRELERPLVSTNPVLIREPDSEASSQSFFRIWRLTGRGG